MPDELLDGSRRPATRGSAGGRFVILALLGAITLGAALALWAANRAGWVDLERASPMAAKAPAVANVTAPTASLSAPTTATTEAALNVRIAELEQRKAQLNLQAAAALGWALPKRSLSWSLR